MALTRPRIGQFNTSVASLSDPITVLHGGATLANVDVGFLMNRANGLVSNVALYWSESDSAFVTAFTADSGATNSNISLSAYADIKVGALTTTGNILPSANVAYDLGSPSQRFRTLYLSGNTIDLGGALISANQGQVTFVTASGGSADGMFANVMANSGATSTSTTTGALQVTGGAGITGNVFVGNLTATGFYNSDGSPFLGAYGNTQVALYLPSDTTITTIQNNIAGANAAIQTANVYNKNYTDAAITNLINLAPATLDTLGEIAANLAAEGGAITDLLISINSTNSNVTAANAKISTLDSNLGTATTNITALFGNAATQSVAIGTLDANLGTTTNNISTLFGNAATQATTLGLLDSNLGAVTNNITTLFGNASTQSTAINNINANLGTATNNITTLFSNASTQSTAINNINANLGTATNNITTLFSNVASQQTAINTLQTQVYTNSNVSAYLPTYTGAIGGTLSTAAQPNITSVGTLSSLAVNDSATVGGNLNVSGNLNVTGSLTTFSSNDLVVNDSIIYIANGNSGDVLDIGIVGHFINPTYQHTGFVRDASDGVWKLFSNVKTEPTTTVDFTNAIYSGLQIGNLSASSATLTGTLTLPSVGDVSANIGNFNTYANIQLQTVNANLGTATTNITTLFSNAATQQTSINAINANLGTATTNITTLFGNAATQSIAISTLDANLGTATTNITTLFSNAATQGVSINGIVNGTTTLANVITTGGVFWANGNVYGGGTGGGTTYTSTGAGNITVSGSTLSLTATGPGAVSVGSSTAIPVITTDIYGRVAGTSTAAVIAPAGTLSGTTLASGVTASSLTSVGNLTSLSVVGTSTRGGKAMVTNYTGATAPANPQQGDEWWYTTGNILYKYINDGTTSNWINVNSSLYNASTSATANTLALRDTGGNLTATNFLGVASSAKYADLAEIYVSDEIYEPGTVVIFGGTQEITVTDKSHDSRVAGVISTNPAYLMNSECNGLPVAFTGRVPCQVQGPVKKGDLLVTSNKPGVAQAIDNSQFVPGCVIGKSLENITTKTITTIEVVVGRF